MEIKMAPVVRDTLQSFNYQKYFGYGIEDVIERQVKFWELDEEETKYLIRKTKNIWKDG